MKLLEEDRLLLLVKDLETTIARMKFQIAVREVQVKYGLSLDAIFSLVDGTIWYPPRQGQNDNAEGD